MKKVFLMLIGAVICSAASAQIVEQGEAAAVYYSPKTAVVLDFTYTEEVQEKGVYAEFAEDLIGTKEAVTETKTTYVLKDVRIGTSSSADYSRPHKVVSDPSVPMLLSINEKGLLTGYNVPPCPPKANPNRRDNHRERVEKTEINRFQMAPYPEDVLTATTPLAQANAAAKNIFHIRETRMYLINGEVEHAPADGEAMRLVLEELDKQEKQLIELFVGKKTKRTLHKKVQFAPEKKEETWYFSEENGFTDAENVEAEKITASITLFPQRFVTTDEDQKNKKKPAAVSQIVYNLPGNGDVKVVYKGRPMAERTIPIAQIGVDVPLAKDMFTDKELPSIVFCEKTGNIVSISK